LINVKLSFDMREQSRTFVRRSTLVVVAFFAILLLIAATPFGQKKSNQDDIGTLEPVSNKKDLYPANADAKKEIDEALKQAVTDKKRVLLVFGGNWCYDCHVLDRALHEGAAGKIVEESFLLVHVDIGEGDKNLELVMKYKTTLDKGVPVVVILRADSSVLYSSNDGEFEAARKMMKKDLAAFLTNWK
jgi:thiol:disulfide interchange protein